MTLLKRIKNDSLQARKTRDTTKATLLTTLYSEANLVGLNDGHRQTTDEEVQSIVKTFIKNLDKTIEANSKIPNGVLPLSQVLAPFIAEKAILEAYLPKQLTEDELRKIIQQMVIDNPSITMGSAMSGLKSAYAGLYDGQTASKTVKDILNG